MKNKLKILADICIWAVVIFAVILSVFVFSSNSDGYAEVFDKVFIPVLDADICSPIEKEDLIIVNALSVSDIEELKPDDIIIYTQSLPDETEAVVIDKISDVSVSEGFVICTFGKNEEIKFPLQVKEVTGTHIIAVYNGVRIPKIGKPFSMIVSSTGVTVFAVIPLVLIFLVELFNYILAFLGIRSEKKPSEEEEKGD